MARDRAHRGGPPRRQSDPDPIPPGREVCVVRRRGDVAVPRGTAERSPHCAHVSKVCPGIVPAAHVLRGVFPADGRLDVHSGHRDDRDVLDFLSRHGRPADSGAHPGRRREPRRGVAEDGHDALFRRDDEGRDSDRHAREGRVEAEGGTPGERPRHPRLPAARGGRVVTFLDRTTDARRFRHWEGNVEADYIYTSGVAGERFFVALRDDGRMLASRCPACKLDYLPPRMFCEDCFAELTEYVEVPQAGRVAAVTLAHVDRTGAKLSHPQVWAFVTFEGIRGGLLHRLLVTPKQARAGMAVRAKLKPRDARTGTIADIEGFEPVRSRF